MRLCLPEGRGGQDEDQVEDGEEGGGQHSQARYILLQYIHDLKKYLLKFFDTKLDMFLQSTVKCCFPRCVKMY